MPWLRSRVERSTGLTTWALEWRDGTKVRHRPLGAISKEEAQDELLDARRALRRGRAVAPALRQVAPEKALDLYCHHLKVLGRRPGTIYHTRNILGPLFRTWSAMPLTNWSRVDLQAYLAEHDWARPRHKTGRALRLPISPPLAEVLERHRRRAGLVCPRLPKSDSSLGKALHRLCDKAGVPRGGWHRLRHSAATLLAAAGVDVATIGRMLGHRPGSVVTLRYLHTDDNRLRVAANAVAEALQAS